MKAEILIPTVQYGNIRFFIEGEADEIIAESKRLNKLYANDSEGGFMNAGLPDKEFNAVLDKFTWQDKGDNGIEAEQYERMSDEQKTIIQAIKRSRKRIEYVSTKGNPHHSLEEN